MNKQSSKLKILRLTTGKDSGLKNFDFSKNCPKELIKLDQEKKAKLFEKNHENCIRLPFYILPLKNQKVQINHDSTKLGKRKLEIRLTDLPLLYQDFEVIKKLKP